MGRYYNDFNDIRGSDELFHYGVQGMKWGIRRYVNYDGTLTPEGQRKYGTYQNFARSSEGQRMLSEAKKKVAIGAAVTAGVLAIAGTSIIHDHLAINAMNRDMSDRLDSLAEIHKKFSI